MKRITLTYFHRKAEMSKSLAEFLNKTLSVITKPVFYETGSGAVIALNFSNVGLNPEALSSYVEEAINLLEGISNHYEHFGVREFRVNPCALDEPHPFYNEEFELIARDGFDDPLYFKLCDVPGYEYIVECYMTK